MRRTVTLFLCALALLVAAGLILVYSASSTYYRNSPNHFVIRQGIALALSLCVGIVVARIDYHFWSRPWVLTLITILTLAGLCAVFLFPVVKGSRRWIDLRIYSVQPSEFAKISILIVLSTWFDRVGPRSSSFLRGFLIPGLIVAVMTAPILLAPDLGATAVIVVVAATVFLAAGTRLSYMFASVPVAIGGLVLILLKDAHRRGRMMDFLAGLFGKDGAQAYQTIQSLNAFVIGGPLGVGLNNSIQKYRYLPEAHTDFIYAIAGEELGLAASLIIILLFGILLICGTRIASRAPDRLGRFLGLGLTVLLCFEAGFNMGMVMGCLPTKGLALPFVSYGGSSLMASMIAVGMLLNIARQSFVAEAEAPSSMRNALQHI
ncbi:MAG: FtsW/RodA/SpoVE family cell cycle protein [Kiritimatiellia bacterium]